jgi:hypothetical protein
VNHRWASWVLTLTALSLSGCSSKKEPWKPPLTQDLTALKTFLDGAGLERSSMSPYIRGKMVVLDRGKESFEYVVQKLLPATLNAATRDEVETVVWIDWRSEAVPGMSVEFNGRKRAAIRWVADLTVIDWKKKRILGGTQVAGSPPPQGWSQASLGDVNAAGGVPGPRPYQELADFFSETAKSVGVPP